jgi:hypothetical protein
MGIELDGSSRRAQLASVREMKRLRPPLPRGDSAGWRYRTPTVIPAKLVLRESGGAGIHPAQRDSRNPREGQRNSR